MPAAKKTASKPAADKQPAPADESKDTAPTDKAAAEQPARSKKRADTRPRAGGHVLTDDGWRVDDGG